MEEKEEVWELNYYDINRKFHQKHFEEDDEMYEFIKDNKEIEVMSYGRIEKVKIKE